jgi:MerR family transcriptional regulator/heat shock protein HspR
VHTYLRTFAVGRPEDPDKQYWTLTEVRALLRVEEDFLEELEQEEIVCPTCREHPSHKVFDFNDLERLRLARILVEDMGVNLPGVDVILRMRQNMIDMRRQFDAILEDLARELRERLAGQR